MDAKSVYSSSSSGFRTPPPYSHAQTAASKSYKYLRSYSDNHSAAPPAAMDGRAVTDGGDGDDAAADDGVPAALHALRGGSSSSSPQSVPAEASGCGVSVATAAAETAAAAAVAVTKNRGPATRSKSSGLATFIIGWTRLTYTDALRTLDRFPQLRAAFSFKLSNRQCW
ncbi:hypothetical protein ACFX2I_033757 [Malus domestica]